MPDLAGSICDCGNPKVFQNAIGGRKALWHILIPAVFGGTNFLLLIFGISPFIIFCSYTAEGMTQNDSDLSCFKDGEIIIAVVTVVVYVLWLAIPLRFFAGNCLACCIKGELQQAGTSIYDTMTPTNPVAIDRSNSLELGFKPGMAQQSLPRLASGGSPQQAADMMMVPQAGGGQYSHGIRIVSGGSAAIYEATKPLTGELLVAKVHTDEAGFRNEVEKMRLFLGRPNVDSIVQFKDMDGPNLTIYMERGESDLRHVMKTEETNAGFTKGILEQVLKALNLIHTRGFVHCDVKPENILVFGRRVKLADLDGVTNKGDRRSDDVTPTICSPEVARGLGKGQPTHEAEDIWAVGALTFELLYKRHPFLDGQIGRDAILAQIASVDTAAVNTALVRANGQQRSFLEQCFEVDPMKRASAAKLIQSGFVSG